MKGLVVLMLLALTSLACGTPGGSQVAASPSTTTSSSPTQPTSSALVLVPSSDGKNTVVEDITDPSHPVIVYTVPTVLRGARFISAKEIGYTTTTNADSPTEGVTTIWRMKLDDMRPAQIATLQGDAIDLAWSPDGSSMAFIADSGAHRLWLKSGTGDPRTITPLIPVYGREYISTDQITVAFSHDGQFLLMVDTVVTGDGTDVRATFQIRQASDGRLLWVPPSALKPNAFNTTMAVWSHMTDRLYFQDPDPVAGKTGIHIWQPLHEVAILAGIARWTSPSISPDDRFVAYETVGTDGKPRVAVRDLGSESLRLFPQVIGQPVMLSDVELIERHFVPQIAGAPGPALLPDRYYALNLKTNAETLLPSNFQPMDFWVR